MRLAVKIADQSDYEHLEPCPICASMMISLETPAGSSPARGACFGCGAKGPLVGPMDQRPWEVAATQEWNVWARARRAQ